MSANYYATNNFEEQEPFLFVMPNRFKSRLVLDDGYSIPLKTAKPNIIRRFFTKALLGWSWIDYVR